jgi:hypothetical protein
MRKGLMALVVLITAYFSVALGLSYAEEEKPLAPGWLSLDSSVGVLDKEIADSKSVLEKALGISISGFLDTSYEWSSNHPHKPANISGRYFDKDYNKIDFNDFNLTIEKPEKDWGVGFKLVGDFGRMGELLREATLWNAKLQRQPSAELREAYITFTLPIGEGLQVKAGKWVTTLGTEILPAPGAYNDNFSRSFLFNYAVPLTHAGTLFTYPALKTLTINGGIVTGWDNPNENNGMPSFLTGLTYSPTDKFALASNLIFGPEEDNDSGHYRVTWSNVATITPTDPLTLQLEYTLGSEASAETPTGIQQAWWYGFSGIATYSWTDRFSTAVRGEVFVDAQAFRTGGLSALKPLHNVTLGEMTFTGSYKFTKMLMGRAEFRQDWANHGVFQKSVTGADANQTTLALQLVYTF